MAVHDLKIIPTPHKVHSLDSDRKIHVRGRVYNIYIMGERADRLLFAVDILRESCKMGLAFISMSNGNKGQPQPMMSSCIAIGK